jgi:hypothetical protein
VRALQVLFVAPWRANAALEDGTWSDDLIHADRVADAQASLEGALMDASTLRRIGYGAEEGSTVREQRRARPCRGFMVCWPDAERHDDARTHDGLDCCRRGGLR